MLDQWFVLRLVYSFVALDRLHFCVHLSVQFTANCFNCALNCAAGHFDCFRPRIHFQLLLLLTRLLLFVASPVAVIISIIFFIITWDPVMFAYLISSAI
jgi:hypothetical protein